MSNETSTTDTSRVSATGNPGRDGLTPLFEKSRQSTTEIPTPATEDPKVEVTNEKNEENLGEVDRERGVNDKNDDLGIRTTNLDQLAEGENITDSSVAKSPEADPPILQDQDIGILEGDSD